MKKTKKTARVSIKIKMRKQTKHNVPVITTTSPLRHSGEPGG